MRVDRCVVPLDLILGRDQLYDAVMCVVALRFKSSLPGCLPGATLPIGLGRGTCYPMLDTTRDKTVIELLSVLLRMCLGLAEAGADRRLLVDKHSLGNERRVIIGLIA